MVVFRMRFFTMTFQDFLRTLEVNNFVSVDFQTQVSIYVILDQHKILHQNHQ